MIPFGSHQPPLYPVKALAYGRVLGGGAFYGQCTPVKALAYGMVLGGGVFYG